MRKKTLKAISTDGMKTRLENLEEYMPGEPQFTYDFAKFLAKRLNPRLYAVGFNLAFQLGIYDAKKGVDGFTNEHLPGSISQMPAPVYVALEMNIPKIAKAVCPEDFAEEVKKAYEEIHGEKRGE